MRTSTTSGCRSARPMCTKSATQQLPHACLRRPASYECVVLQYTINAYTLQDNKDDWKSFLVQQLIGARTLYADWTERIKASMLKQYKFCINMRLEVVDRSNPERVSVFVYKNDYFTLHYLGRALPHSHHHWQPHVCSAERRRLATGR